MPNKILLKRSSTASSEPVVGDLELGEFAYNSHDGRLFAKKNDGSDSIIEIGAGVNNIDGGSAAIIAVSTFTKLDGGSA